MKLKWPYFGVDGHSGQHYILRQAWAEYPAVSVLLFFSVILSILYWLPGVEHTLFYQKLFYLSEKSQKISRNEAPAMNINWSFWPLSTSFYVLHCCNMMTGWMGYYMIKAAMQAFWLECLFLCIYWCKSRFSARYVAYFILLAIVLS